MILICFVSFRLSHDAQILCQIWSNIAIKTSMYGFAALLKCICTHPPLEPLNIAMFKGVHTWGVFSGQIVLAVVSRNPLVKINLVYF